MSPPAPAPAGKCRPHLMLTRDLPAKVEHIAWCDHHDRDLASCEVAALRAEIERLLTIAANLEALAFVAGKLGGVTWQARAEIAEANLERIKKAAALKEARK